MAITEKSTPVLYSSAHEDLFYTVLSDNIAQPNFKYVFDVYAGATLLARLKVFPEPLYSLGICNVSQIVRSYLANFYFKGQIGTWIAVTAAGYFYKNITVKYGEEYGTPVTLFTNLTIATAKNYYNYYNDILFRDIAPGALVNYADNFLTSGPTTRTVSTSDNFYMYYWNNAAASLTLTIRKYNSAGTLLATQSDATLSTNELICLNVGPVAINTAYPAFIDSSVAYYTIQVGSVLLTFNIDCYPMYQNYRVVFWNQQGGFETVPFRMKSGHRVDKDTKQFGRSNYRYDSNGVIFYQEETTSADVLRGNSAVYASTYKHTYQLSTDFLTDAEFSWLQQLVLSPLVYIEFKDGANNYHHFPVSITDKTYQIKTRRNDKLNAFAIEAQILQNFNTQFG
jgi:hypothetical protein